MELKITEETDHGFKVFDTTAALNNVKKYEAEKRGLESALERTNFELNNSRRVLDIINSLSRCWYNLDWSQRYFFFTSSGEPALPVELKPEKAALPPGYQLVKLRDVKKIKCPGCTEMRELIGYQTSREPGQFVLCGNSVHIIK